MNYWLVKTEPGEYSFDDLVKAKREVWDGVRNAAALQFIRQMKKGDRVLVYHSGKDKSAVGIAEVVKGAYPDPEQDDEKLVVVDLKPIERLPNPVTLASIKADKAFADFHLVRISRLSIMPVPPTLWKKILKMAGS